METSPNVQYKYYFLTLSTLLHCRGVPNKVVSVCWNKSLLSFDFGSHCCFPPFLLKNFSEQIKVFRNIASHYSMSFLEETIDWLLDMSPQISRNTR